MGLAPKLAGGALEKICFHRNSQGFWLVFLAEDRCTKKLGKMQFARIQLEVSIHFTLQCEKSKIFTHKIFYEIKCAHAKDVEPLCGAMKVISIHVMG